MAELRLPPAVRLLFEVAVLRLQVKVLQAELRGLKEQLANLEPSNAL
jgi:hypothetical protein